MHPFLGLTSWAAFTPDAHGGLKVVGGLVLFEDEVNPVMSAALDNGSEVTVLHNHFFFDSPRVMFMHIGGNGAADKLVTAVRRASDKVKGIRTANPQPGTKFSGSAADGLPRCPAQRRGVTFFQPQPHLLEHRPQAGDADPQLPVPLYVRTTGVWPVSEASGGRLNCRLPLS